MTKTLTDAEYFAIPAISKSQLHAFTRSNPMAFWNGCKLNPKCKVVPENDAIANGKLRHTLLLEPHKLESEFVQIEGGRGLSSRATQAFQKIIAENPGKTVVTKAEVSTAQLQIDTLKSYQLVQDILKGGTIESPVMWTDEATDLPLKAKLDLIKRVPYEGRDRILIVEYKTTGKDMGQLMRGVDVPGWHWDAGMQFKAIRARYGEPPFRMVFLVQSQQEGCENCICPFVLPEEDLLFCVQYVDDTLAEIKNRFEQWKSGNPNAWKTHLAETTFQGYGNSAFSFAFDKELSQMGA